MFDAIPSMLPPSRARKVRLRPNMMSRRTIRLQLSPKVSSVRLIGHPERRWCIRSVRQTDCKIEVVSVAGGLLAQWRTQMNAAPQAADREEPAMANFHFGMNQSLDGYVHHTA